MLMGTSRIFSSKLFLKYSHFIHFDSIGSNLIFFFWDSVYSSWHNIIIWIVWNNVRTFDYRFRRQDWCWSYRADCYYGKFRNLANFFPKINIKIINSKRSKRTTFIRFWSLKWKKSSIINTFTVNYSI